MDNVTLIRVISGVLAVCTMLLLIYRMKKHGLVLNSEGSSRPSLSAAYKSLASGGGLREN